jgi:hypothetical protein
VLADPLRDIGLRGHHALLDRTIPGELQVLFFAIGWIGDGTDGQDDFYQSALHTKNGVVIIRPIDRHVSEFRQEVSCLLMRENARAVNITRSAWEYCHLALRQWANSFAASQNCIDDHLVASLPKPAALTFDTSVQCFEHTK